MSDETMILETTNVAPDVVNNHSGSLLNKIIRNKLAIALLIVLLIIIISCIVLKKQPYRNKPVHAADSQSDWSVEKEVMDLINQQERMIQSMIASEGLLNENDMV